MDEIEIYTENEDDIGNVEGLRYYLKQKWKLSVTLVCLFGILSMGFQLEISGSTMLPLSHLVSVNLGDLSWIVAARSLGFMITVIIFGVIFQSVIKNHCELILSIGYILPAAATILTPYLRSLWALCVALLFQGMAQGISDLAINTLVTTMWKKHSTSPLNCVCLGYPVGALLSIAIVRLFRINDSLIDNNNIKSPGEQLLINKSLIQSELIGPYTISSVFCLISSIGFGIISYKQRKIKKEEKMKKVRVYQSVAKEEINLHSKSKRVFNKGIFWKNCSPTTCGEGYFTYGFILVTLLILFNFFFGGLEQGFTKFFVSFVEYEQINLNKKDSIYSMIFYWLPMLIGRIFCTFLAISLIDADLILTLSLLLSIITYLLWIIFIWYIGLTPLSLFILVTINGLSVSPIYPTTIGWIKQFLSLSPIELTFLLISNAAGGIIFGLLCGYVFQYYNSKHLFIVLTVILLLCSISFILSFTFQYIHTNKINKNKSTKQKEKKFQTLIKDDQ